ncbi:conjugal transfer protein TraF [Vibrio fluvialis]|nr:conjugal transfer protein TraF [Vibrio fluvialis]
MVGWIDMKIKVFFYVLIFIASINHLSFASDHVGRGFSWYDSPAREYTPKKSQPSETMTVSKSEPTKVLKKEKTYGEKLDDFHAKYKNIIAKAMLEPSLDSVYELMKVQDEVSKKGDAVSDYWKQNLLLHEYLNYEASHPIAQQAIHEYDAVMDAKKRLAVVDYQNRGFGLFYVYRESDIYGSKYASQVQSFADEFGFDLLGVSLDGSKLDVIRKSVDNNGKLNINLTPALVLVNPENRNDLQVIAFGVKSTSDLIRNISFIHNGFKTLGN